MTYGTCPFSSLVTWRPIQTYDKIDLYGRLFLIPPRHQLVGLCLACQTLLLIDNTTHTPQSNPLNLTIEYHHHSENFIAILLSWTFGPWRSKEEGERGKENLTKQKINEWWDIVWFSLNSLPCASHLTDPTSRQKNLCLKPSRYLLSLSRTLPAAKHHRSHSE